MNSALNFSKPRAPSAGVARACLLGAALALAAVGVALYFQHVHEQDPCALCILQRYAWLTVAGALLVAGLWRRTPVVWAGLGVAVLAALAGAGTAVRQLWVIAHPDVQCGRDALEAWVNHLPTARALPEVFQARGFCSDVLEPMLGLTFPQWSLLGLAVIGVGAVVAGAVLRRAAAR